MFWLTVRFKKNDVFACPVKVSAASRRRKLFVLYLTKWHGIFCDLPELTGTFVWEAETINLKARSEAAAVIVVIFVGKT